MGLCNIDRFENVRPFSAFIYPVLLRISRWIRVRINYMYIFFGFVFSQAIVEGHTMLMSGQVGKSPLTKKIVEGGIEPETKQVRIYRFDFLKF